MYEKGTANTAIELTPEEKKSMNKAMEDEIF